MTPLNEAFRPRFTLTCLIESNQTHITVNLILILLKKKKIIGSLSLLMVVKTVQTF